MIGVVEILLTGLWLFGALTVRRTGEPGTARRHLVTVAAVAVVIAVTGVALSDGPGTGLAGLWLVPAADPVTALVITVAGLLAVGMSPRSGLSPSTLTVIGLLIAMSTLVTAVNEPAVPGLVWVLSSVVVWWCLPGDTRAVFGVYHGVGCLLFLIGTALPAPWGGVPLTLAVALRLAVVPLHSWFPHFVDRAPLGVAVAFWTVPIAGLSGLNTGLMVALGVLSALVGALSGAVAVDAGRAAAYLLTSANGLFLIALGTAGAATYQHALVPASAGLLMVLAAVRARRGSWRLDGGDLAATPRLAGAYLVFGLCVVGFPLLALFAVQETLIHDHSPWVATAVIPAVACGGVIVMRGFLGLFAGVRAGPGVRDLLPRETLTVTVALGLVVLGGLFPVLIH